MTGYGNHAQAGFAMIVVAASLAAIAVIGLGIVGGAFYAMNRLTKNQNMLEDYNNGY